MENRYKILSEKNVRDIRGYNKLAERDKSLRPMHQIVIFIDELAMQEGYSTAPDKVRALGFGAGMGLPNIKKYTDEMKIDTEKDVGTTISLKVYTAH